MSFFLIEIERILGDEYQGLTEQRYRVATTQEQAEKWLTTRGFRHIHHTLWERETVTGEIWRTILQAVIYEVPGV